jgi:hypothetical protein
MTSAPAQLVELVVDAADPEGLARFWAGALRWTVAPPGDDIARVLPSDDTTFGLSFRRSRGAKLGQNRIHFDLTTSSGHDMDGTVQDLLGNGASHIDIGQRPDETHVVLADPEGNELCVIDPSNRFLASCPRLGAVNCDGTRALGLFWSGALGWPIVWDQDEETAIQAPEGTGPKITWSGPPLMPRWGRERFHFHLAPAPAIGADRTLDHLVRLGATRLDAGADCPTSTALADVDGNPFCLVDGRHRRGAATWSMASADGISQPLIQSGHPPVAGWRHAESIIS